MRTFYSLGGTLIALIAVSMLAGCSGNTASIAPSTAGKTQDLRSMQRPWLQINGNNERGRRSDVASKHAVTPPSFFDSSEKGEPLVFVSDYTGNVVDIYRQHGNNKMVGQITGLNGPSGLASDPTDNLYVTTGSSIPIYASPYTGMPLLTLDDTGFFPNGVAISRLGVVGVTNFCNAPSCGNGSGNVVFFAPNSTTQCARVADPYNFGFVFFDAFNNRGDLYITGESADYTRDTVGVVRGGCKAKAITLLTTNSALGGVPSIRVDRRGRIAITSKSGSVYAIVTYKPPKNGSLGAPVSTTLLSSSSTPAADFAFTASGRSLYEANILNPAVAYKYEYPAGGTEEQSIAVGGQPFGVAVTPPLVP
jgi:hypothetical protein